MNGQFLYNANCTVCHIETDTKVAPAMHEIKENYLRAYPEKNDFVNGMTTWLLNPNATTSMLQHAVDKYKVMPDLAYDKQMLNFITSYIYDTKFKE